MSVGEPDLTELGGESAVETAASLDLSSQEDVSCIFLPSFSHTLDFNSISLGSNTCSSQFFLVILRSTPRPR